MSAKYAMHPLEVRFRDHAHRELMTRLEEGRRVVKGGGMSKRLTPEEWALIESVEAGYPTIVRMFRGHIAALEAEVAELSRFRRAVYDAFSAASCRQEIGEAISDMLQGDDEETE